MPPPTHTHARPIPPCPLMLYCPLVPRYSAAIFTVEGNLLYIWLPLLGANLIFMLYLASTAGERRVQHVPGVLALPRGESAPPPPLGRIGCGEARPAVPPPTFPCCLADTGPTGPTARPTTGPPARRYRQGWVVVPLYTLVTATCTRHPRVLYNHIKRHKKADHEDEGGITG